jgi:hypothetical protein
VVTYVDETPEIPKQDKVEVLFYDVFGEPMEDLSVDMEVDGQKQDAFTMSRGQVHHLTDQDQVAVHIRKDGYGFEKIEDEE